MRLPMSRHVAHACDRLELHAGLGYSYGARLAGHIRSMPFLFRVGRLQAGGTSNAERLAVSTCGPHLPGSDRGGLLQGAGQPATWPSRHVPQGAASFELLVIIISMDACAEEHVNPSCGRHAGLVCLAQIAEGCCKVLGSQLRGLVDMCLKMLPVLC